MAKGKTKPRGVTHLRDGSPAYNYDDDGHFAACAPAECGGDWPMTEFKEFVTCKRCQRILKARAQKRTTARKGRK